MNLNLIMTVCLAIGLNTAAHADDFDDIFDVAAQKISGHWNATGGLEGESFELAVSPRSYSEIELRQVGSKDNADVPYPTTCKYRQSGTPKIMVCRPEALKPIEGYCNMYGTASKYILEYKVEKIELLPDWRNDKWCNNFIALRKKAIANGSLLYAFPYSLDRDGNLIQYGRNLYKKAAPQGTPYTPAQNGSNKTSVQ